MAELSAHHATGIVSVLGGFAVVLSYVLVFRTETAGYTASRYWLGTTPVATASALIPLQIAGGLGFLVFVACVTGCVGNTVPTRGILSYGNGFVCTATVAIFLAASSAWPFATQRYLDLTPDARAWSDAAGPVAALVAAALSAIVMVAGAFEGDMHPAAICGVLVFAMVVVLADGVGWNSMLILKHPNGR